MSQPTTRIAGALLVPMDGPADRPLGDVRHGDLRLAGDRIVALGSLAPLAGERVVDAGGLVAVPGFVQTHVHFCQTLFRGLADDRPLLSWLRERIWPLEAAHDADSVRASAELSIAELLRGGTTAVQVMESVRHTEQTFAALAHSGMTAIVGNCLMDVDDPHGGARLATSRREALAISEALCDEFDGVGRMHYAVSPRFLLSCSEALSRDAAAFAADRRLRIHSHAAEHPDEVATVEHATGTRYVLALRAQGLLGARTGLAHCVHLNERERAALAETDTAVLHCPSTNLKLGSGIAAIAELAGRGIRVGLGADGAPCNNRLSALTELRTAALLQALAAGPGAWPAARALWTATRGGAIAVGLDAELGRLAIGLRADLVLFDPRAAHLAPCADPLSAIVYAAETSDIRQVWLGGRLVCDRGELSSLDVERVAANAGRQQRALLRRAGLTA